MKPVATILIVLLVLASDCRSGQPISVSVSELLGSPKRFTQRLIRVKGYYAIEHHGAFLCTDKTTLNRAEDRIHLDFDHSPIPQQAVNKIPQGPISVTGIFQYRDLTSKLDKDGSRVIPPGFGWMNIYDKQITKISDIRLVPNR